MISRGFYHQNANLKSLSDDNYVEYLNEISLEFVKNYMGVDYDYDDDIISSLSYAGADIAQKELNVGVGENQIKTATYQGFKEFTYLPYFAYEILNVWINDKWQENLDVNLQNGYVTNLNYCNDTEVKIQYRCGKPIDQITKTTIAEYVRFKYDATDSLNTDAMNVFKALQYKTRKSIF